MSIELVETNCDLCGQVRPCVVWLVAPLIVTPDTGTEAREEARCTTCVPPMTPEQFIAAVKNGP